MTSLMIFVLGLALIIIGALVALVIVFFGIMVVAALAIPAAIIAGFVFLVRLDYPENVIFSSIYAAFIIMLGIIGYISDKKKKRDGALEDDE